MAQETWAQTPARSYFFQIYNSKANLFVPQLPIKFIRNTDFLKMLQLFLSYHQDFLAFLFQVFFDFPVLICLPDLSHSSSRFVVCNLFINVRLVSQKHLLSLFNLYPFKVFGHFHLSHLLHKQFSFCLGCFSQHFVFVRKLFLSCLLEMLNGLLLS